MDECDHIESSTNICNTGFCSLTDSFILFMCSPFIIILCVYGYMYNNIQNGGWFQRMDYETIKENLWTYASDGLQYDDEEEMLSILNGNPI